MHSSPVNGPDGPVHLRLSRLTTVTAQGRDRRTVIIDDLSRHGGATSCGVVGHTRVHAPADAEERLGLYLDCACDVECPRCHAAVRQGCVTLDGGGLSGGGYPTKTHAVRVKASPWCQGLLAGTRSPCDFGAHRWGLAPGLDPAEGQPARAVCAECGRVEPIHDEPAAPGQRLGALSSLFG